MKGCPYFDHRLVCVWCGTRLELLGLAYRDSAGREACGSNLSRRGLISLRHAPVHERVSA